MSVVSFDTIDRVISAHGRADGALIPILQDLQAEIGYLPPAVLAAVAERTGIPYSEVTGVVSFYSYFTTEPRGDHTVRVCLGTACYVRGGKDVLEAIKSEVGCEVGRTTEDRRFTLEIGRCFGACGLAPVVMVDDDVHQRVRPSCVRELLAGYPGADQTTAETGTEVDDER